MLRGVRCSRPAKSPKGPARSFPQKADRFHQLWQRDRELHVVNRIKPVPHELHRGPVYPSLPVTVDDDGEVRLQPLFRNSDVLVY